MASPHRRIWETHNGKIPKDDKGRSLEVHHINGNRADNTLSNLQLVTIEEHYAIHAEQGDWGACALISKRMDLPPDHASTVQLGKKRPGVGGAKKGRTPWNKGITGYKLTCDRKGKVCRPTKLTSTDVRNIRRIYTDNTHKSDYDGYLSQKRKGGPSMSYEWFTAKMIKNQHFSTLTTLTIYKVITGQTWQNV